MKATDELKEEHQGIDLMLKVLSAISDRSGRNERIQTEHLDGIIEFLSIFVDKCHHGKEEEFLFPALETEGVKRDGGPIGVLLNEHEQGRKLVAKLKDAMKLYTSGENKATISFQSTINEYVALLTEHIEKENNVLFVMADAKLNAAKDTELFEAFERLEKERIGPGKHEEFHELLKRLRHEYLG